MILDLAQIITSILIIISVVLQAKDVGLGGAFGGSASFHSKRGAEKSLFFFTIVMTVLFLLFSFLNVLY